MQIATEMLLFAIAIQMDEMESGNVIHLMMKLMVRLYNLQTRKVGINQFLNVYMSPLDEDVNQLYIN
jgi:hypothetical protein